MWIRRHARAPRDTEPVRRIEKPAGPLRSSRHFQKIRHLSPDSTRFAHRTSRHCAKAFDDALAALAPSDRLFAALYYAEQLDRSQMAHFNECRRSRFRGAWLTFAWSCTPQSPGYSPRLSPRLSPPLGRSRKRESLAPSHPRRLNGASHTLLKIGNLKSRGAIKNRGAKKALQNARKFSTGCWPTHSSAAQQILASRTRRDAPKRSCFPHMRTARSTRMRPCDGSCISPIACGPRHSGRVPGARKAAAAEREPVYWGSASVPAHAPGANIAQVVVPAFRDSAAGCRSTPEPVCAPGVAICLALDRSSRHVGDRRGHRFCFAPLEPASYFTLSAARRARRLRRAR